MINQLKKRWVSSGLAMFSMFFGAGNVIFPLIVGFHSQGSIFYALLGLIITAVIVPFSGLLSITLFEGNYIAFFNRLGKTEGALVAIAILSVLGPFGAIPRCITLTYSTFSVYFPSIELPSFIIVGSLLILLFCIKKNRILELLGLVLTPLLLLFLLVLIIKGLITKEWGLEASMANSHAFFYGLKEGYFTMDLLAAFFFSSVICERLKAKEEGGVTHKQLVLHLLKASSVGAGLLGIIYVGFALVAALYSWELQGIAEEHLLGGIGKMTFGALGGLIVCFIVALSCLTTAIALTLVAAEFLEKPLSRGKINYHVSLFIIVGITALVSFLGFSGIKMLMTPILIAAYPSLLMLSFLNICYKLFGFKIVKSPVIVVFIITLLLSFI